MKSKKLLVLVIVLILSGLIAGCGKKKDEASGSGDSKKKFTVGFDASFPPYGYEDDNGEYVGFDLELAQEVCKRNNWELVKQPIDWDSKDMELDSGTIDCIWNGFTINGREDGYTWSKPYVDNSQVVVVTEKSGIKSLADLKGKEVVVQADSSALSALEGDQAELAGTFANLTEVPEYNTAFMNLESGAADAVAMDVGVANYQLSSRKGSFMILDEVISAEQYGIGFKKGNESLRDTVQKTLDEMVEDGTFMEIAEKWELSEAVSLGK